MKKIAIVGAGFAGLSVCHHVLQYLSCEVTLFDPLGIGGGASGVSTGLLYPFPARLAIRSWMASEGMNASKQLISVAENALQRPVALRTGVLRVATLPVQVKAFLQRAKDDPEAIWIPNIQSRVPLAIEAPGLWIPSGMTVFSKLYLEGLWKACEDKGAQLQQKRIDALQELDGYDAIVLCAGAQKLQLQECASYPLELVKGQTLLCKWNHDLDFSLVGLGHITPTENPQFCQIGSTYERQGYDVSTTPEAISELREKVQAFYPPSQAFEVVSQAAGIRVVVKNGYRPIAGQIGPKTWAVTGLGSRGLLYHAFLGERIALSLKSLHN